MNKSKDILTKTELACSSYHFWFAHEAALRDELKQQAWAGEDENPHLIAAIQHAAIRNINARFEWAKSLKA